MGRQETSWAMEPPGMVFHRFPLELRVFGGWRQHGGRRYGPGPPLKLPWPGNRHETAMSTPGPFQALDIDALQFG